jgi:putative spermidine/putrescine transport system permease protein
MTEQQTTIAASPKPRALNGYDRLMRRLDGRRIRRFCAHTWLWFVVLAIYAPILVVIGASFDPGDDVAGMRAFLVFPPRGFSLEWYWNIHPRLWQSLWVSISMASLSCAFALVLGVPAALGLIRGNFRGKIILGTLFRAPIQMPAIVIGVAFLQAYYAIGNMFGIPLVATFSGLVIGHVFVAVPYVIGAVGVQLQRFNPAMEEAALIHGASRWRTFRRITVPIVMPGLYAGGLYAFLVSFADVTISLFLSGPNATPFPVHVLYSIEEDFEPTIPAMSTLVFFGSLVILLLIQRLVGLDVLLRGGGNSNA